MHFLPGDIWSESSLLETKTMFSLLIDLPH